MADFADDETQKAIADVDLWKPVSKLSDRAVLLVGPFSECRIISGKPVLYLIINRRVFRLKLFLAELGRQNLAVFSFDRVDRSFRASAYRDDIVPALEIADDNVFVGRRFLRIIPARCL